MAESMTPPICNEDVDTISCKLVVRRNTVNIPSIDPSAAPPGNSSQSASETAQVGLAERWLRYFRVDYAQELDLGTLAAIADCIRDGVAPPSV